MANQLNSWEDDPAAQDENLARQTQQQMNLGQQGQQQQGQQGGLRAGAAAFQSFNPGAYQFTPGQQQFGGQGQGYQGYQGQGYQQYPYGGQQGYQGYGAVYGQQQGYNQYGQYPGGYPQQQMQGQGMPQQQQQGFQRQQQPQQQQAKPTPTIAKRPADAAKPVTTQEGGAKVLSIGKEAAPKTSVSQEGGAKVLSIGGEAAKPKAAKVLTIGAPKAENKKEEAKKEDAAAAADAGAKATATKAIEKTGAEKADGSGKTSPTPSSGRSSPARAGEKKVTRDAAAVEKEQTADVDAETLKEIYGKEHVNVIFIGHVDAGKSTLGGSILFACGMVDTRTMEKYKREAKELGRESWWLSWALDLTSEERAKGKTVELGRAFFETEKRRYSILDAPGHKLFVSHMIGGASQADVGVLVISARKGEYEAGFEKGGQTREHAMLAKTQGVNKLVVVINKMDDSNWSQDRYKECTTKLAAFLKATGYGKNDVFFMPIAAQLTMGIKERIPKDVCPWYDGPSLLEYLDNMQALERKVNAPFMMSINGKYKDMGTIVEGRIESGVVKKGMSLIMMPNKTTIDIAAVYGETEDEVPIAQCGDQIRMRLRGIEEDEIMPGFVLCSPKRLVHNVSAFEAQIRILDLKSILTAGYNCVLHVHAAIEEVTFAALLHKLQKGTNRKSKLPPSHAKKGDSIIARLEITGGAGSVCVEAFEDYPQLGRFTLRDQGQTIAIGKIIKLITDPSA